MLVGFDGNVVVFPNPNFDTSFAPPENCPGEKLSRDQTTVSKVETGTIIGSLFLGSWESKNSPEYLMMPKQSRPLSFSGLEMREIDSAIATLLKDQMYIYKPLKAISLKATEANYTRTNSFPGKIIIPRS